ncbi:MAG: tRNA preQ1(34) S-adenosylmethionine ribosyltransferase-isomerase QueA [Clostridiales Family XIII bacterium]|jgi:S-adenosylmethionine:tRNA ribosyltransferase-isomerase|nr:tRNA preQ1(34) S-adenosylmethionine ribosyltransferase-isomerase QueA [Clostridiales Family XIII bacterium]
MNIDLFNYELPPECIAQHPAPERDGSRLLVLDRADGSLSDRYFRDLPDYLREGDLLVFNDSKVIRARLIGSKEGTGAKIELFLLKRCADGATYGSIREQVWECLARPARRLRIGDRVLFAGACGVQSGSGNAGSVRAAATVTEKIEDGGILVAFEYEGDFADTIEHIGRIPLPPYIHRIAENDVYADEDAVRYQTVYAQEAGSAAAPTAGLHFTEKLLERIRALGAETAFVTLHVGLGTFRPVKTERVEDHVMHLEPYHISEETARRINAAKAEGRRVICVGTTSVRTLESSVGADGHTVRPGSGSAGIFIYPGGRGFAVTDALITNFHLPKSTLLMLVSAFAGREQILKAYTHAIASGYRFFSYGDAMFIE